MGKRNIFFNFNGYILCHSLIMIDSLTIETLLKDIIKQTRGNISQSKRENI